MPKFNVTFRRTNGSGDAVARQHVTAEDEDKAVSKAVSAAFGRKSFFKADLGLGPDYGQVFRKLSGTAHSVSLTPRVRIDVDEV